MKLGISGVITRTFIRSPLTPLILFASIVLGAIALVSLPREEEPQISVPMIDIHVDANGLKAVCAQRLLPTVHETITVAPATEVLLNTPIVQDRIRDAGDEDIPAIIAGSGAEGMHDFTSSLGKLVDDNMVDLKTALRFAPNREALMSRVRGIEMKADALVQRIKG